MVQLLKKLGHDERGATAVEYGLILALIFVSMMAAVSNFGQTAVEMWFTVSSAVSSARANV